MIALMRAITEDGVDVRGYCKWAFMDNFEWGTYGTKNYGVYAIDFNDPDRKRVLKKSEQFFIDLVRESRIY